ncbi:transglycosylase SLT domain-containing protein [Pelagibacterium lacus]|uniref:Lytic transglycosylase domain-containing protein n=1 Tax=Pelagibacterium lacus TaxID=2282655 RepID=A0A369W8G2_9HYPH|nr:transglycosylase SLT domain-containing protein [Pelagibacterium lacus]RDE10337.1 lytic transglycosylase domain-containing protein [Pelagibacterium lacus]
MVSPIADIPQAIAYALDRAGARNGVDFDYLLQTAMRESSLNPAAKARTSSASGLFQFIESTWLEVMKDHGPRLGYGDFADRIQEADGEFFVADAATRQQILDLRFDPQVSADLAAAFTRSNGEYLTQKFGRMPSPGELYIAHFLGRRGAERFFELGLQSPEANAASAFPRPAAANPTIFYHNGQPRSVREVYQVLVARHGGTGPSNAAFAAQQMASQGPDLPSRVERDLGPVIPPGVSFTSLFSTQAAPETTSPVSTAEPVPGRVLFSGFYSGQ